MTAVFTDFDSTMAEKIVVDSVSNTVDVTFRNSGATYRYSLSEAEVSDIVSIATARSKGKTLHQLLNIQDGVRVADTTSTASNVAVPNVGKKPVSRKVAQPTAKAVKPTKSSAKVAPQAKARVVSARNVTI